MPLQQLIKKQIKIWEQKLTKKILLNKTEMNGTDNSFVNLKDHKENVLKHLTTNHSVKCGTRTTCTDCLKKDTSPLYA